ncbi:MAG: LacI family DNA-binding transcriptional regulator [Victivallales bacterium]|nr:LacI family DNA-binding transcriptional regulator [Victivallales bacterium]
MSIQDIAKLSGVSITTVSRYFNMPDKVSAATAKRICEASEQLHYKPRVRRPGPKTMERMGIRSGLIVLLFLGKVRPNTVQTFPSLSLLMASIQDELNRRHLSLIIEQIKDNGDIPEVVDPRYCDGLILHGLPQTEKVRKELQRVLQTLPAIWTGMESDPNLPKIDEVLFDNDTIGTLAADYLCENGHKNVALVSTASQHPAFSGRISHFQKQAKMLGMHCQLFETALEEFPTYAAICQHLAKQLCAKATSYTAIFFCADDAMLGITQEMRVLGCDISRYTLLGVNNDHTYLRFFDHKPASVDFKPAYLGRLTVDQLLRRINGRIEDLPATIKIHPEVNTTSLPLI